MRPADAAEPRPHRRAARHRGRHDGRQRDPARRGRRGASSRAIDRNDLYVLTHPEQREILSAARATAGSRCSSPTSGRRRRGRRQSAARAISIWRRVVRHHDDGVRAGERAREAIRPRATLSETRNATAPIAPAAVRRRPRRRVGARDRAPRHRARSRRVDDDRPAQPARAHVRPEMARASMPAATRRRPTPASTRSVDDGRRPRTRRRSSSAPSRNAPSPNRKPDGKTQADVADGRESTHRAPTPTSSQRLRRLPRARPIPASEQHRAADFEHARDRAIARRSTRRGARRRRRTGRPAKAVRHRALPIARRARAASGQPKRSWCASRTLRPAPRRQSAPSVDVRAAARDPRQSTGATAPPPKPMRVARPRRPTFRTAARHAVPDRPAPAGGASGSRRPARARAPVLGQDRTRLGMVEAVPGPLGVRPLLAPPIDLTRRRRRTRASSAAGTRCGRRRGRGPAGRRGADRRRRSRARSPRRRAPSRARGSAVRSAQRGTRWKSWRTPAATQEIAGAAGGRASAPLRRACGPARARVGGRVGRRRMRARAPTSVADDLGRGDSTPASGSRAIASAAAAAAAGSAGSSPGARQARERALNVLAQRLADRPSAASCRLRCPTCDIHDFGLRRHPQAGTWELLWGGARRMPSRNAAALAGRPGRRASHRRRWSTENRDPEWTKPPEQSLRRLLSGSPGRSRTSDQSVTPCPAVSDGVDYLITMGL